MTRDLPPPSIEEKLSKILKKILDNQADNNKRERP